MTEHPQRRAEPLRHDRHRADWEWGALGELGRDFRYAARALRRTPGFTMAAVLSLGLGVALIACTLAVVNAYLIRSLPYPAAHRLYHVIYAPQGQPEPRGMSALDWKALSDVVEVADNSAVTRFYLSDGAYTQEAMGLLVAEGSLEGLGVRAAIGRSFETGDYRVNAENVALIAHVLWRDRFGSDRNAVGRLFTTTSGGEEEGERTETYRIVGVLPPEFRYARDYGRDPAEILVPLRTPMRTYMVRLREGVPIADAERRITAAVKSLAGGSVPPNWAGVQLESVHVRYIGTLRPMLIAMTVAAGLVLVIVIANVAILTLLRTMRRHREVAVRFALGAAPRHIVRLLVAEAFWICGAALALGLTLTTLMLNLLAPIIESQLDRPVPGGPSALGLDTRVLLMVGGVGLLAALSLAFLPLLTPWQRRLADSLRRDHRTSTDGPSTRWARSGLIALEVAGSLALLVGCGLMIRSVVNLVSTDLGFRTDQIVRTRLVLPANTYPDDPALLQFYERLTDQIATRTNVAVTFTNFPPLYETPRQAIGIDGSDLQGVTAGIIAVSPSYFDTLGIDVIDGRAFGRTDRIGGEPVAVISETLAKRFWPNGGAIGHSIRTAEQPFDGAPVGEWRTIVGIARDVRQDFADQERSDIYLPFLQVPSRFSPVLIRTDRPPAVWLDTLRASVGAIDQDVMVGEMTTLDVEADQLLAGTRFLTSMLTGFAGFATLLAILGIYGVTAYAVQQREPEVAIRMALGATGRQVVRMFLKEGSLVLVIGIIVGLLGARIVARTLESQLHGVPPFDLFTLAATCVLMVGGAVLATWWPAGRVASKSPSQTLNEL